MKQPRPHAQRIIKIIFFYSYPVLKQKQSFWMNEQFPTELFYLIAGGKGKMTNRGRINYNCGLSMAYNQLIPVTVDKYNSWRTRTNYA